MYANIQVKFDYVVTCVVLISIFTPNWKYVDCWLIKLDFV